jgi:hypothetical protein
VATVPLKLAAAPVSVPVVVGEPESITLPAVPVTGKFPSVPLLLYSTYGFVPPATVVEPIVIVPLGVPQGPPASAKVHTLPVSRNSTQCVLVGGAADGNMARKLSRLFE